MKPLMGTSYEEMHCFLQLPETLAQLRTRLMDIGLSFVNQLLLKGQSLRSLESCGLGVAPSRGAVSVEPCMPVFTLPRSPAPGLVKPPSGRMLGYKRVLSKASPSPLPRHQDELL